MNVLIFSYPEVYRICAWLSPQSALSFLKISFLLQFSFLIFNCCLHVLPPVSVLSWPCLLIYLFCLIEFWGEQFQIYRKLRRKYRVPMQFSYRNFPTRFLLLLTSCICGTFIIIDEPKLIHYYLAHRLHFVHSLCYTFYRC